MTNPRQAIRSWITNALTGHTVAGTNVQSSRKAPVSQEPSALLGNNNETARIIVWSLQTKSEVFDESPRRYRHSTDVVVECLAQIATNVAIDDSLDAFEEEVLKILLADDTCGGLADDLQLVESRSDIGDFGDRIIGGVAITFRATYYTTAPLDGTQELDDFETLNTGYNLSGEQPDDRDRARSIIEDLHL